MKPFSLALMSLLGLSFVGSVSGTTLKGKKFVVDKCRKANRTYEAKCQKSIPLPEGGRKYQGCVGEVASVTVTLLKKPSGAEFGLPSHLSCELVIETDARTEPGPKVSRLRISATEYQTVISETIDSNPRHFSVEHSAGDSRLGFAHSDNTTSDYKWTHKGKTVSVNPTPKQLREFMMGTRLDFPDANSAAAPVSTDRPTGAESFF